MTDIRYPSPFDQKVLAREAPGSTPARVNVTVPTVTRPGEPFDVNIAVADEAGYPSVACDAAVRLRGPFRAGEVTIPFEAGRPAVATVGPVTIDERGLHRFEADLDGRAYPGTPTCCTADPAVRPIYWGDPHVHTVLSNCHPDRCRSLLFCFVAARHFAHLDWVTAADHVSNGRCELARWKEQAAMSNAFNDPPAFVTVPGYEASLQGGAGGDNNVYLRRWPEMFVDVYEDGDTRVLAERLAERVGDGNVFLVPHHTTRTGKHGEIPAAIYPGPRRMPVVEIHSKWGTSEYRGNPAPLETIHHGPSYVVDLLGRGLRLGFIGGTDTHATMPAGFGVERLDRLPGLTAVRAERLTRDSVFDAIAARDCYATSLERIYLDVTVAGRRPGRELAGADVPRPRRIDVTAAAQSDITAIDIVRNGRTLHTHTPDTWHGRVSADDNDDLADVALTGEDGRRFVYYYVRVTCAGGAQAWSSPVWIEL
ncbi:MAG: hypothetical protein ACOC95_09660 [Planctomycetota bacterium]